MALQKEIWLRAIVEQLFADNMFISKAYNADAFVTAGKTVHIPNAGAKLVAKVGPIQRPQDATEQTDTELTFDIKEFYTSPIFIANADKYELSYNKRESVVRRLRGALQDEVAKSLLTSWMPTDEKRTITLERAKLSRKDVLKAATKLNQENIPQEGRYLLLDATMHEALLSDLTEVQANAFLSTADAKNGIVGKLYGFNVMMRSVAGGTEEAPIALAWHEDYVCRALGDHEIFIQENDPHYYADVISFLIRAGGSRMSKDGLGTVAIKAAGTTTP